MKVSTKSRYAIKLLLDISENEQNGNVSLRDVSKRTGIPLKYLEQIAGMLCRSGFIRSYRGAQGGYALLKKSSIIRMGEVVRAMEGDISAGYINDGEAIDQFWSKLYEILNEYMDSVTLHDIEEEEKRLNQVYDYYI